MHSTSHLKTKTFLLCRILKREGEPTTSGGNLARNTLMHGRHLPLKRALG